jgi:hypothetical protein
MEHRYNLGQPIASPHSHGAGASQAGELVRSLRVVKRIAPQPMRWYPLVSQSGTLSDWNRQLAFSKRSTSSCRSGKHHAPPMTRTGWRCGRSGSARKRFRADGSSWIGSFGQLSRARRDVSRRDPIIHAPIDCWFAPISSPFQAGVSGKDCASGLFSIRL